MPWIKEIGTKGGGDGGWRDDLPLHHELPDELEIDCSRLRLPIQPMFSVRVRVFVDWHTEQGRDVQITPPRNASPAPTTPIVASATPPSSKPP